MFDDILAIIKYTPHRQVVNVFITQGIHLSPLKLAHPTIRRQHKNIDAEFAPQCVFNGRASITRSCTYNIQGANSALELTLKQLTQELHVYIRAIHTCTNY